MTTEFAPPKGLAPWQGGIVSAESVRNEHRVAWLIGAAFAPLVALSLSAHFGLVAVSLYLLSGAVCTLLALRTNRMLSLRD